MWDDTPHIKPLTAITTNRKFLQGLFYFKVKGKIMCNHGTKRNYRMKADMETFEFETPDGRHHSIKYAAHEYSVNDMFCVRCGDWVEAKGVMGALLCPVCCAPWDNCPQCHGTNKIPNGLGTGEAAGGWADYCDMEHPLPTSEAAEGGE